jgi:hypothetical protein
VAEKKPFLLRLSPDLYDAIAVWAGEELRSVNGQIEFLLRQALLKANRPVRGGARDREARRDRGTADEERERRQP